MHRGFFRWTIIAVLLVSGVDARAEDDAGDAFDSELPHPKNKVQYRPLAPKPRDEQAEAAAAAATPVESIEAKRDGDEGTKGSLFGSRDDATSQPSSAEERPVDRMLKGELSLLGQTEFLNPQNFAGAGAGYFQLDSVSYLAVTPMVDLHFLENKLHLDFGGTLNITLFDPNGGGFKAAGRIRTKDWDQWQNWFRIIRRVQFGKKEDHFFVRLSRVGAASLGHGGLMRRYNNNMLFNQPHVGLELDYYNDYFGGEAFVSDITFQSQVMGGILFIKPLAIFLDNAIARSLSLGGYYTGDLAAPARLRRDADGVVITDRVDIPRYDRTSVHGVGADFEIKPIRVGDLVDVKVYGDFNQLINYGNGVTVGVLGRFNVPAPFLAIRARLEYRNNGPQYLPSYFDTFYEIQKLQFVTVSPSSFAPTKLDFLKGLRGNRRNNMYAEIQFSWVDKFAIAFAYEAGEGPRQQSMLVHAEFTAFDWLRFFATYHKRNFDNWNEVFRFQQNDLFFSQARLEILPILFLNGRAMKTFLWDPNVDFGLGAFKNVWDYRVDLELGWQW